jgi:hypothetical protein
VRACACASLLTGRLSECAPPPVRVRSVRASSGSDRDARPACRKPVFGMHSAVRDSDVSGPVMGPLSTGRPVARACPRRLRARDEVSWAGSPMDTVDRPAHLRVKAGERDASGLRTDKDRLGLLSSRLGLPGIITIVSSWHVQVHNGVSSDDIL